MSNRPLAFLAFADDRSEAPRILSALEEERRRLLEVFEEQKKEEIRVKVSDGGIANLISDLRKAGDDVVLFHFAGHANGQSLHLELEAGKGQLLAAENLVTLLGQQPRLQVVFLHACATWGHVESLLSAGIPAVIATAHDIGDTQATAFSQLFYQELLAGKTLREAFSSARIRQEPHSAQDRIHRSAIFSLQEQAAQEDFAWGLYVQNDHALSWRLSDAEHSPLTDRLRAGSRLRHQELRSPGGRFEHLDISEVLLTSTRSQLIETDVKLGEERLGRRESVEKLWAMNPPHSIVLGDGGMGKTVSLLRLWERFLEDEQGPIPIFVQLNEFNQATTQNRENWLTWYIARHYLGERPLSEETEQQLWSWLEADWDCPYPKLILLLDGFNEITVDNKPLLIEFQQEWRGTANGIQILLSSRYGNNFTWAEDFQKLELQPLDEARAGAYLQALGLPWPGPDQPDLRRLLCNPMMLTIYAATSEFMRQEKGRAEGFKPNASTGELMWNFIHAQTLKFEAFHSIDEEQIYLYRWLIWHLLPWIGYEMEQRGLFSLPEEELLKLIQAYPTLIAPDDRWAYKKLFKDADRQWRSLGKDISEAQAWTYYDILTQTLRLFRPEGEDLAFLHQNFRDFFAALHLRNSLMLDVDRKRPPGLLIPRALSIYLRRMLGEIEGEHHNAARLEGRRWSINHQQPTLLTRALDGCRGLHGPQRPGLAVFNLLEMIHDVRGEWTGVDMKNLDLYGIPVHHRLTHSLSLVTSLRQSYLSKETLFPQGHSRGVYAVAYQPIQQGRIGSGYFISGSDDGSIKEWDPATGACTRTFEGHQSAVNTIAYRLDGDRFLSGLEDGTIKEWDTATGECIRTFEGHKSRINSVAYRPDGGRFISGSDDGSIKEWDPATGACIRTFEGQTHHINSVAYRPDGGRFISGSNDGTIKEWDTATGACIRTFEGHSNSVRSITYRLDGRRFLSGSMDSIKEWDTVTGDCIRTFERHFNWTLPIAYRPDGERFISGSSNGSIKEWDTVTGACIRTFDGHINWVLSVEYRPDGGRFLSGSHKSIMEWDTATGICIRTFERHFNWELPIAYRPDGGSFLSGSDDGSIQEWDTVTGICIRTFKGHSNLRSVAYSPDGGSFLSGSANGAIQEWDTATGECIRTFDVHKHHINSVGYHPDGKRFLSGSNGRSIQEWDTATGECIRTFEGHNSHINSVAYRPDGGGFISGSVDWSIKEWDPATGACIRTFEGHSNWVRSVAYRPDGGRIISGSSDGTIKEWDAETGECLRTFPNIPGLNVQGWDFRGSVHDFTEEDIELLRMYGAIFSEEDEARWRQIMAEEDAFYAGEE